MRSQMYWYRISETLSTTDSRGLQTGCEVMFRENLDAMSTEQILLSFAAASRFYERNQMRDEAVIRAVAQEALHHEFDLQRLTLLNHISAPLHTHLKSLVIMEGTMSPAASLLLDILNGMNSCEKVCLKGLSRQPIAN